jgi:hypothetical protein
VRDRLIAMNSDESTTWIQAEPCICIYFIFVLVVLLVIYLFLNLYKSRIHSHLHICPVKTYAVIVVDDQPENYLLFHPLGLFSLIT